MEFRWAALIALWTFLAGPALHQPTAIPQAIGHIDPPPRTKIAGPPSSPVRFLQGETRNLAR